MKFLGKLILYVLIAIVVVVFGLYFLLQTRWGAEQVSAGYPKTVVIILSSMLSIIVSPLHHMFCWRM